jgi:hypothetical protein
VTLGRQLRRPDLPTVGARWCEAALPAGSVYRFLARFAALGLRSTVSGWQLQRA